MTNNKKRLFRSYTAHSFSLSVCFWESPVIVIQVHCLEIYFLTALESVLAVIAWARRFCSSTLFHQQKAVTLSLLFNGSTWGYQSTVSVAGFSTLSRYAWSDQRSQPVSEVKSHCSVVYTALTPTLSRWHFQHIMNIMDDCYFCVFKYAYLPLQILKSNLANTVFWKAMKHRKMVGYM